VVWLMLSGTGNNQPVPDLWLYGKGKYKRWLKHRCTIYFYSSYFSIFVIEKLTSGNWTLSFRRNRISLGHHFWRCWNNCLFIIIANKYCGYDKESESAATNLQLMTMVILDQNTCHGWWWQEICLQYLEGCFTALLGTDFYQKEMEKISIQF